MSMESCLIRDCRTGEECNARACRNCGWNPEEMARRNRMIALRGLRMGSDGLHRLVLRPVKKGGHSNGTVADQR